MKIIIILKSPLIHLPVTIRNKIVYGRLSLVCVCLSQYDNSRTVRDHYKIFRMLSDVRKGGQVRKWLLCGARAVRRRLWCSRMHGTFVPENFRSREQKFHRWNFYSLELSFPNTDYYSILCYPG